MGERSRVFPWAGLVGIVLAFNGGCNNAPPQAQPPEKTDSVEEIVHQSTPISQKDVLEVDAPPELVERANYYFNNGLRFAKAGELDKAYRQFDSATKTVPEFIPAYLNKGLILYKQDKHDEAITVLGEALKIVPWSHDVWELLGDNYVAKKNFSEAIAHYDESIKLNSKDPTTYLKRGTVYAIEGEIRTALKDFEACLQLQPKHPAALHNAIRANRLLGDDDYADRLQKRLDKLHEETLVEKE